MKIGIVLGSLRDGRNGRSVADWVLSVAQGRQDAEFGMVDVLDYDLPLLTDGTVPAARQGVYPDPKVQAFADAMAGYDGYVFVTAEYNHGIPGGFKNAIDHLGPELQTKPVAFVSYGAGSGLRSVEQWRQVVANFNMFDIRDQVALSLFNEFDETGCVPGPRREAELTGLFDNLVRIAGKLAA